MPGLWRWCVPRRRGPLYRRQWNDPLHLGARGTEGRHGRKGTEVACGEARALLVWRRYEAEPSLLLGLRQRPARGHPAAKLRRGEPLLMLVLVLVLVWVEGVLCMLLSVHVGRHRSWFLRWMGQLAGAGPLMLLYLQILEPWQRREKHFRNLRAPTGSRGRQRDWRRTHDVWRIRAGMRLRLLRGGDPVARRGRILLHCAQRAANRILVISCGYGEHPTALAPPAKRVLHKPKVYFRQLGVGRDKTMGPTHICQRGHQVG